MVRIRKSRASKKGNSAAREPMTGKRLGQYLSYMNPDYNLDYTYDKETIRGQEYSEELDFLTNAFGIH